jgi:hypothetical protein
MVSSISSGLPYALIAWKRSGLCGFTIDAAYSDVAGPCHADGAEMRAIVLL